MKGKRNYVILHLSVLLGCIIPFGNIFGPLLVGASMEKKDPQIRKSKVNIVNFQIIWFLLLFPLLFAYWYKQIINLSKSEGIETGLLVIILAAGIVLFNFLYPILIATIIGITNKVKMYYPSLIKFIK